MNPPTNLESLPPEVVTSILVDLPVQQVVQTCRTSRYLSSFCQSYPFWAAKAQHDFQLPPPVFLANQTLDPRARYQLIWDIDNYRRATTKFMGKQEAFSTEVGKLGDVQLVDYFTRLDPMIFDLQSLMEAAIKNNQLDLIGYVIDHHDILTNRSSSYTASPDFVLARAMYQRKLEPTSPVLQYIMTNYPMDVDLNHALEIAADSNQLNLVKYFYDLGAMDLTTALKNAVRIGSIPIINYLLHQGVTEDETAEALNQAIYDLNIEMVKYLLCHAPFPRNIDSLIRDVRHKSMYGRKLDPIDQEIIDALTKAEQAQFRHTREEAAINFIRREMRQILRRERKRLIQERRSQGILGAPTNDEVIQSPTIQRQLANSSNVMMEIPSARETRYIPVFGFQKPPQITPSFSSYRNGENCASPPKTGTLQKGRAQVERICQSIPLMNPDLTMDFDGDECVITPPTPSYQERAQLEQVCQSISRMNPNLNADFDGDECIITPAISLDVSQRMTAKNQLLARQWAQSSQPRHPQSVLPFQLPPSPPPSQQPETPEPTQPPQPPQSHQLLSRHQLTTQPSYQPSGSSPRSSPRSRQLPRRSSNPRYQSIQQPPPRSFQR